MLQIFLSKVINMDIDSNMFNNMYFLYAMHCKGFPHR